MLFSYDPYEVEFLVERRASEAAGARRRRERSQVRAGEANQVAGRPRRALLAFRVLVDGEFAVRVADSLASTGVDAASGGRLASRP